MTHRQWWNIKENNPTNFIWLSID